MRLFIAAFPPPEVVSHLSSSLEGTRAAFPELRWQAPDRWHITLAFLGETDPVKIDAVLSGLHEVAFSAQPLAGLRIAGAGRFGTVLWVGIESADARRLQQLVRACRRTARAAGASVDRTKFVPHLTVARGREHVDRVRAAETSLEGYSGPDWTVASVRLVESITGPSPRYETLGEFGLGSGRLDG